MKYDLAKYCEHEIISILLVILFVIWQSNVTDGYGQSNVTNDLTGKFNDSAFELHNLYSPGELGVWFNITAKVIDTIPPEPGTSSILANHIGDPKRPTIVNHAFVAGWNQTGNLIHKGDCLRITGISANSYMNKSKIYADSIKQMDCKDLPPIIQLPTNTNYTNSKDLPPIIQLPTNTNYTNNFMGIKFEYPRIWDVSTEVNSFEDESCKKRDVACQLRLYSINGTANLDILAFRGPKFERACNCSSLLDMVRLAYHELTKNESKGFSFVNDNRTTVAQHKPAWQMEYNMTNLGNDNSTFPTVRYWDIYTIVNGTYYVIRYQAYEGLDPNISPQDKLVNQKYEFDYTKSLPQARRILDSLQFIPAKVVPPPKVPSFMQSPFNCPAYSLIYSAQWTLDSNSSCNNAHWSLSDKNGRLFVLPVQNLIGDTTYMTKDQISDAYSKYSKKAFEDPSLSKLDSTQKNISNITSQQLYYTENGDQGFLKHLEEYIPAQGGGWIIHFYAPGNDFTSALPDVEKILTSIRFNTR